MIQFCRQSLVGFWTGQLLFDRLPKRCFLVKEQLRFECVLTHCRDVFFNLYMTPQLYEAILWYLVIFLLLGVWFGIPRWASLPACHTTLNPWWVRLNCFCWPSGPTFAQWKKPLLFRVYRDFIGDYTTQIFRDHNKPLKGSLLNSQYSIMESRRVLFVAH